MTETQEGNGIKDALVNQAKNMIRAKKDAKAAAQAEQEAAEMKAKLQAEEEAEEALRWLTHEELRTGNYERYIAAGSRQGDIDEKNKEMMLTDEEFNKVGGKHIQYLHRSRLCIPSSSRYAMSSTTFDMQFSRATSRASLSCRLLLLSPVTSILFRSSAWTKPRFRSSRLSKSPCSRKSTASARINSMSDGGGSAG